MPSPTSLTHATLLALALLTGAPTTHAAQGDPVKLESNAQASEQAQKLIKLGDAQALKDLKRVAITQFNVQFVTADNAQTRNSGFGGGGSVSAASYYQLTGLGDADFQAVVEAAYARFVQQLKDAGLDVLPAADVAAAPKWRSLVAAGKPLPERKDDLYTVAPPGMGLYGLSRVQLTPVGAAKGGMFGAFANMGAGLSAMSVVPDNMALQQELGDAAVLEVSLQLHFAHAKGSSGLFGLSNTAEIETKAEARIIKAHLSVQKGPGMSVLELQRPLTLSPTAFKELRKHEKTKADTAAKVFGALINLASGSNHSHDSERYDVVAEPEAYREAVTQGIERLGVLFTTRLQSAR